MVNKNTHDVRAVTTCNLDPNIKDKLRVRKNIYDIYNPQGNVIKHKLILITKRQDPI